MISLKGSGAYGTPLANTFFTLPLLLIFALTRESGVSIMVYKPRS